jgi:hypothetical protein
MYHLKFVTMKSILASLLLILNLSLGFSNTPFHEKMKAALRDMSTCKSSDDFKKAANTFERVSKMEPGEWLPVYYQANIYILLIYVDQTATTIQKDQYLDQAETLIAKMEKLVPREAEVQTLKAFLIISRIGIEPQSRGAAMYQDYVDALGKAVAYGPENPRVKYMVLSKEVGQANFFGQSTAPFCQPMKDLLATWDSYPVVSDIHPVWGKEQLNDLLKGCKQ